MSFGKSRSLNSTNSSMMVRSGVILNELKGKLKVVENKEHKLEDFKVDRSVDEDRLNKERK